jgi:hypothetical protein
MDLYFKIFASIGIIGTIISIIGLPCITIFGTEIIIKIGISIMFFSILMALIGTLYLIITD